MLKVKMLPDGAKKGTDGISQVIRAYMRYLPAYDVQLVPQGADDYDLIAAHAGWGAHGTDVSHCHGMYWTADFPCLPWEFHVNGNVIESLRKARAITVPSTWVAETIARDMHIRPEVIPHGIEWESWQDADARNGGFVLWNKNRSGDVCDPRPMADLAGLFPSTKFVTTFQPKDTRLNNVTETGLLPHLEMKKLVKSAGVYLSTTKETFGIGILEAMASGVPVLGFDQGGASELVDHGVTGYLARPGNMADLADGLNYCLQHGDTLGANGREAAKLWTWQSACEKVAALYHRLANGRPAPEVSVIIPVYNKTPDQIARAVQSVVDQETQPAAVIVVDDGSDDPDMIDRVVTEFGGLGVDLQVIHQPNQGVAFARNAGVAAARTPYVCCLDADDAIAPEFLRYCVNALYEDPALGIAYTKITWVDKDGNTGLSNWPNEFDYDAMLERRNQVPTCCVFRRDIWERIGGYRQRYAPTGAGSEDAEFWLRIGAAGYGARLVTRKGLFLYSVGGGYVSGNPDYTEVDWTSLHPWANDKIHPFASVATPSFISHPVRQYDEPMISVVIPVGPGHEKAVWDALDFLEAQNFRGWEAIVVWDGIDELSPAIQDAKTAFPFIRSFVLGGDPRGAGWARNFGASFARAPFLVFLDADDWFYPTTLSEMLGAWNETGSIVYTDYVGRAIIAPEDEIKLAPGLAGRIYHRNEKTNEVIIGHKAFSYDCELAQTMPAPMSDGNPYIWANVTVLIPKAWHDEIGGFDETMTSWEDVDYHWRLARRGKCYYRLERELLVYNFHKGHRRERGLQSFADLVQYLRQKYEMEEWKTMPCDGCGGRPRTTTSTYASPTRSAPMTQNRPSGGDFVMAVYNYPKDGDHRVIGQGVFNMPLEDVSMVRTREGFRIDYQYKNRGEKFYVHRRDIEAQPSIFVPVEDAPRPAPVIEQRIEAPVSVAPPEAIGVQVPRQAIEAAAEPRAPESPPAPPTGPGIAHHLQQSPDQQAAIKAALAQLDADGSLPTSPIDRDAALPTRPVYNVEAIGNPQRGQPAPTKIVHDAVTDNEIALPDVGEKIEATAVDLQLLPGVGAAGAARMAELGLTSEEAILALGAENLVQIPGISEIRAAGIVQYINNQRAQRESAE